MSEEASSYDAALARGRGMYAGTRIGRPGHGGGYWLLWAGAQFLRLRWAISMTRADRVQPGPAILVGNHLAFMDPVMVGLANRWRLYYFTKSEAFEGRGGIFFRLAGQIPLRRGDEVATNWALEMSSHVLAEGRKLALYPEATRSPDGASLHRLYRRVLVPVLRANPGIPVHAVSISYPGTRRGRKRVDLRFSPALPLDLDAMNATELTDAVRDAILSLGGMPYVDRYGLTVKKSDPHGPDAP
ncbi:MAG: lysophospholipid acyltransferase family protein [Actinomycetota bacterium]|nr:lysophospholipid acyltransferase family protein [Actinomycetota bacterium]